MKVKHIWMLFPMKVKQPGGPPSCVPIDISQVTSLDIMIPGATCARVSRRH